MFASLAIGWFSPGTVLAVLVAGGILVIAIILSGKVKPKPTAVINFDDATAKAPFPACTLASADQQIGCRAFGTHELSVDDIVFFRFPEQERGGTVGIKQAIRRLCEESGKPGGLRPLPDQLCMTFLSGELSYPKRLKGSHIVTLGRVWQSSASTLVRGIGMDKKDHPDWFHLRAEQDSLGPKDYIPCIRESVPAYAPQRAKTALAA